MAKRKPRTKEQALDDLSTLMRDIFPYLHLDYRGALMMAMKALEREDIVPENHVACTEENPCCDRRGEYNGFGSGPLKFVCPKHCSCHD